MAKVEVNEANLKNCRCPYCPVQAESKCPQDRLKNFKDPEDRENMAKLYCSIGKTDCEDLNEDAMCMCPSCQVWDENGLQSMKYCLSGNADEIG